LDRNEGVDQHIRRKTHKNSFWVKYDVNYLCRLNRCFIFFL